MSKALTLWHKEILIDVPGCPKHIITRALLDTARDFCAYTLSWTAKHASIDSDAVSGSDIAFVASGPDTITSTSTDLSIFTAGQIINTDNSDNPGPFTLAVVAENTLTLVAGDDLTATDAASTKIGASTYALTSTDGDIVEIDHAIYDHVDFYPTSEYAMDHTVSDWRTRMSASPSHYLMGQDRYIRLVYCPYTAVTGGIEVWVCLKPLTTATTLEDYLYTDYFDCLSEGTRARLLRMPKQTWTDKNEAMRCQARYEQQRNIAGTKKNGGYVHRTYQVKMRAF